MSPKSGLENVRRSPGGAWRHGCHGAGGDHADSPDHPGVPRSRPQRTTGGPYRANAAPLLNQVDGFLSRSIPRVTWRSPAGKRRPTHAFLRAANLKVSDEEVLRSVADRIRSAGGIVRPGKLRHQLRCAKFYVCNHEQADTVLPAVGSSLLCSLLVLLLFCPGSVK